jgi:hypothetical protein
LPQNLWMAQASSWSPALEAAGGAPTPRIPYTECLTTWIEDAFVLTMLAAWLVRWRLFQGEPRELAVAAWSQVHGLATLLLDGQLAVADDAECEALVRRCAQIQYGGLGRRGRLASAGVRAAKGS